MRILIVKTSSMGDVVHALPAVRDVQRLLQARGGSGTHEIDWLVEPAFAAMPQLQGAVAQVHRLPWRKWRRALFRAETWSSMAALVDTMKDRRYDLVIDCQGLLKSAWWARRAAAPVHGYDRHSIREPLASAFYAHTHPVSRSLHAVARCRLLATAAVSQVLGHAPPTEQDLGTADFGLQAVAPLVMPGLPSRFAVLIPNASRPEKHWPEGDWQAVGQHLGAQGLQPVVLWGSGAEEAMAHRIAQGCGAWVPPFLTVEQAARLLAAAEVVVGLDTGFSHVAAALGRPVVGIYCDHEPGLTGITGPAPGASLGGRGQRPALTDVLRALQSVQATAMPPAPAVAQSSSIR